VPVTRGLLPEGAWSGGQWSLVRALLGLYLAVHFAALVPYAAELFSAAGVFAGDASPLFRILPSPLWIADTPAVAVGLVLAGALAGVALALGWRDRIAALVAWYVLACLLTRDPLITNPSLPYVGLLLLVHAAQPRAPYGSLEAVGRTDPAGGWRLERGAWLAYWTALAVGYTYSGWTKLQSPSWLDGTAIPHVLENPLARPGFLREALAGLPAPLLHLMTWGSLAAELAFLPLALWSRTRPWIWLALAGMHFGLLTLIDFTDLSLGMLLAHAATFDPAWVRGTAGGVERLYYDGSCGLCHRAVRFALAEDADGSRFRVAPLFGPTFEQHVPQAQRSGLPDSVVVQRSDGRLLVRSDAVLHLLARLGGAWRLLATAGHVVPRPLRDAAYDAIARLRKRLFAAPKEACPLLPGALRERFEA